MRPSRFPLRPDTRDWAVSVLADSALQLLIETNADTGSQRRFDVAFRRGKRTEARVFRIALHRWKDAQPHPGDEWKGYTPSFERYYRAELARCLEYPSRWPVPITHER